MKSWLFSDILRFLSIGTLAMLSLVLLRARIRRAERYLTIALCFGVACYLLIGWRPIWEIPFVFILVGGAFIIPIILWLLSNTLFNDHFQLEKRHWAILGGVIALQYCLFFLRDSVWAGPETTLGILRGFLPQMISFIFVVLAAFAAYSGRQADLIESRIRLRSQLILLSAVLIASTLFGEIVLLDNAAPQLLEIFHKGLIFVMILYFAASTLTFSADFYRSEPTPASENESVPSPQLIENLESLMAAEKFYREEGLTIGRLSEKLNEKEYKLRRVINQHLGYRNFNDFLNQYRIREACGILEDPQQAELTILEIAYHLGYKSLGPFNGAFKQQTGLTPTAYRKVNMQVGK